MSINRGELFQAVGLALTAVAAPSAAVALTTPSVTSAGLIRPNVTKHTMLYQFSVEIGTPVSSFTLTDASGNRVVFIADGQPHQATFNI